MLICGVDCKIWNVFLNRVIWIKSFGFSPTYSVESNMVYHHGNHGNDFKGTAAKSKCRF